MPDPALRSHAIRLSRRREISMAGLSLPARGLLHRLAIDVAHRPRAIRTTAGQVHLGADEALVSLSAYAEELGAGRHYLAKLLGELAASGWVEYSAGPAGMVVRLLRRLGEDPAAEDLPEASAGEGGVVAPRPPPWSRRDQPYSSTPQEAPQGREPNGCCFPPSQVPDARARGDVVAPPGVERPASALDLPPPIAAACDRAGVRPGLAAELLAMGYDPARVLGRLLQLEARLRDGPAVDNPPGWLRDRVRRGHAPERLHEAAKAQLGLADPWLPLPWLPAQAEASGVRVDRGPEPIGDVLARMLSPPAAASG